MSNMRLLVNVQYIRAIAALLVVFVHLGKLLNSVGLPAFGWGGVDLFFVTSGFIMVLTTIDRNISPIDFMTNRIARVVPLYWLTTLVVFFIAVANSSPMQATGTGLIPLLKSLLFIPYVKSNGLESPIFFVGWTLNYEMFFYVLFAIGLAARNYMRGLIGVIIGLIFLAIYGAVVLPHGVIAAFYTSPLILEFVLGMVIGLIHHHIPQQASRHLKMITIAAILLSLVAIVLAPFEAPAVPPLFSCGIPAAITLLGAVALERWNLAFVNRPLVAVGNASFSIYLTHPFVTQLFQKFTTYFQTTGFVSAMLIVLTLIVVCLMGWLIHIAIEQPLSSVVRRALHARRLAPDKTTT